MLIDSRDNRGEASGGSASAGRAADLAPEMRSAPWPVSWRRLLGIWAIPGTLAAFEMYLFSNAEGHRVAFWRVAAIQAAGWYVWAVATPAVFALVRRYPLVPATARLTVLRHAAACLACILTHGVVYTVASRLLSTVAEVPSFDTQFGRTVLGWLPFTVILYAAIVGTGQWMVSAQRERASEAKRSEMAAQLAMAQLSALRRQMQPHFLLNTLNTIALLVREQDTDTAVLLISKLGAVLRSVLASEAVHEVPLQSELSLLESYLTIEQVRFGDRLTLVWRIDDAARSCLVPALILQPLVENALKHGLSERRCGGRIEIGARRTTDALQLWVCDDGRGLTVQCSCRMDQPAGLGQSSAASSRGLGVGLANARARLARLYGDHASLTLDHPASGGTIARVLLPARCVTAEAIEV